MAHVRSIQNYTYPQKEIEDVILAMTNGLTLPAELKAKYRFFELGAQQLMYDDRTLVPTERQNEVIETAYAKTFAGINRLHAYIMSRHLGVKQSSVAAWLARSSVQQQHRHQPTLGSTKPRVVHDLNNVWQVDLMYFKGVPILVVVDLWSKFGRVSLLHNQLAKTVAKALNRMFEEAKPKAVSCDNGSEFQAEFSEMLRIEGIHQIYGRPGQPTSQASAERFVRTVRMALERYLTAGGTQWRQFLPEWADNYNDVKHLSTGFAPRRLQNATGEMKERMLKRRKSQVAKLLNKRRQIHYSALHVGDLVRIRILRKGRLEKKTLAEYSHATERVTKIVRSKYNWEEFKLSNNKVYRRDQLLRIPNDTMIGPHRPRYLLPRRTNFEERDNNKRLRKPPERYMRSNANAGV
eukprot:Lithocolla_globosa_v1_NODE_684_length_3444_cov_23.143755.p1 type:complete len:407 gc:universal NODE_684_length_3444_cov_23.143755:2177-3397(+)